VVGFSTPSQDAAGGAIMVLANAAATSGKAPTAADIPSFAVAIRSTDASTVSYFFNGNI
jgi:hypothetical protein